MQTSQQLATPNASIIESIETALHSMSAASEAAAALASHLSPILPNGAPEEINSLLAAGARHEDANEDDTALDCLIRSLARRADALAGAITATHEAVRA